MSVSRMNYHRANSPDDSDPKAGSVIPAAQSAPATRDPYNSAVGAYYGPGYAPAMDQRRRIFRSIFLNICAF